MKVVSSELTTEQLIAHLHEARARLLELIADLDDQQMIGPRLAIVNPLRWEIAHVAHFQEFWLLRHQRGYEPIEPASNLDSDKLYDSARVHHDTRWDLPLPSKQATIDYTQRILDRVSEAVLKHPAKPDANGYDDNYFLHLSLLHEDMHNEAITYTRQTLGYSAPSLGNGDGVNGGWGDVVKGDALIPGGTFRLGSELDSGFVFDNELRSHEMAIDSFAISRTAVSNSEFLAFVEADGYRHKEFWSEEGWLWRTSVNAEHPIYWRQADGEWQRRVFDRWVRLELRLPVLHVNWFEADAYCRWAGRRLPTEAEWEMAASLDAAGNKRKFPWGNEAPASERANLDWRALDAGCLLPVDALPESDNEFGVRQMIGNVWEWTATDFGALTGFIPGPYKEYSAPWFGNHKVLRGGCWATRSRLIRSAYRNFYKPDRRDVWAGFRTCAK